MLAVIEQSELQPYHHKSILDLILKESQRKLRKSQLNNY